ncbi:3-hydroxybutyryl-CoA dehydrogenase [Kyrpidia spormannii]|uniref:L-gulonate 3-dehydrogenase n=2 Tax=Kyrpidia spormannii TaxID=2055160 RepID=A0A6F9EDI6_9BACL|nr:3-hydroxybutyryl-CoA dehydrogenase [Kyrpidia spormannii]CAB3393553.1 3-hydroxybutyryl-CoA dehydrogenase [Kyrpidia spormannii]CAB3394475.1 3-hydroxybutyryl-CoA dehydrogenase [Kyrpidia spormannii]
MSARARVAVVGAGRMGTGIAHAFTYSGHPVTLIDLKDRSADDQERVESTAMNTIRDSLSLLSTLGVIEEAWVNRIMDRVSFFGLQEAPTALKTAEVVFEAVPEVLDIKRETYAWISSWVRRDALIASTTSSFLVDELAHHVAGPERFFNTHWLNPAFLIPLVEVSPSECAGQEQTRHLLELLRSVGKIPVLCKASPGYIVPRLQALVMNEAARIWEEGVATVDDIDTASRLGFGFRFAVLGLLEFIDWGGGDILYYVSEYLRDRLGDDRFAPAASVRRNMQTGRLGMRSGQGFYDFSNMSTESYRMETLRKFVELLRHLELLRPPVVE